MPGKNTEKVVRLPTVELNEGEMIGDVNANVQNSDQIIAKFIITSFVNK